MAQVEDVFRDNYRRWHTRLSYAKSAVRILGCALALACNDTAVILAVAMLLAELLGVAEEWI